MKKDTPTYNSIMGDLKKGNYAMVYFLQGEEIFYTDRICDYIEEHALQPHEKDFNLNILYGKDVNVGTILNNARKFPWMSDRQVVIVKEAQEVSDLDSNSDLLIKYLQNPLQSTILVFAYKHKKLDGRKQLNKVFNETALVLTSEKVKDYHLNDWINNLLREKGLQSRPDAVHLLAEFLGTDLSRIDNEVEKLKINLKPGETITADMVMEFIGISKDYNVFELQTAIVKRNVEKAYRIVNYFQQNPKDNNIIGTLAILFSFFTKMVIVASLQKPTEAEVASKLKIPPYHTGQFFEGARNYPARHLVKIIRLLRNLDAKAKGVESGSISPGSLYQELLIGIFKA